MICVTTKLIGKICVVKTRQLEFDSDDINKFVGFLSIVSIGKYLLEKRFYSTQFDGHLLSFS